MFANCLPQIAVDEAVPYSEFKANPYTAIVATSLGGHLCWFEMGGGRWFARPVSSPGVAHDRQYYDSNTMQVCNFLNAMESEIEGVDKENGQVNGDGQAPMHYDGADFQPMRRRMYIRDD